MDKLKELRALMDSQGLDAYIIPSGDAHGSGYTAPYWQSRAWFSGFTGSSGLVVVTKDKAGLWTDGRYFIQAARELEGSGIDLFKSEEPGVPKYEQFLADNLPKYGEVGFDGRVITCSNFDKLKSALEEKSALYSYYEDLVGVLWKDRPLMPTEKAFEHEPKFAGKPSSGKLADVREVMKEKGLSAILVVGLDDVAWLLNIRGHDIPGTPVVYSYALVTETEAHVFISLSKVLEISSKLSSQGFTLHEYDSIDNFLKTFKTNKLFYNPERTNVLVAQSIPASVTKVTAPENDIILNMKAVKSETELSNIKNAYIKEGAVLVKALKWIDEQLASGAASLKEGDVADKVTALRGEQADYLFDSFTTIAAYGPNAAQAHYRQEGAGADIKPEGFFLLDTGGQYLDGTTDTTRTIAAGPLSDEMKRDFTLVLKGHIALAQAVFLSGTMGIQLDVLARLPLWESGQNYRHGTGHGIGYCLSVHEGPHSVSQHPIAKALKIGMILSNEPGIYKEGRFGIRTENTLLVAEKMKTDDGIFLEFENLTYCPIDTRAIDAALLTDTERDWVNAYHEKVYETLSARLSDDEREWLKNAVKPI